MRFNTSFHIKLIIATILAGGLTPLVLYKMSYSFNVVNNGFTRKIIPINLKATVSIDKPPYIYSLALSEGTQDSITYLAHMSPQQVVKMNLVTGQLTTITLTGGNIPANHVAYSLQADSANFYVFLANEKKIYQVNQTTNQVVDSMTVPYPFLRTVLTAPGHFAMREFRPGRNLPQGFAKGIIATKMLTHASENTPDAYGIGADGTLLYDASSNSVLFVPFYSGIITYFDTSLHIRNAFHTIDTITVNKTISGNIATGSGVTKATTQSPRYPITTSSCIQNGKLYLLSGVRADNQSLNSIREEGTVDVYSISTQKYLHSFNIPAFAGEKVLTFNLIGKRLIALYNNYLTVYTFQDQE